MPKPDQERPIGTIVTVKTDTIATASKPWTLPGDTIAIPKHYRFYHVTLLFEIRFEILSRCTNTIRQIPYLRRNPATHGPKKNIKHL